MPNDFIDASSSRSQGRLDWLVHPARRKRDQGFPSLSRDWNRVRRERKRQKRTAGKVGNIRGMPAQLPPGTLAAASFIAT